MKNKISILFLVFIVSAINIADAQMTIRNYTAEKVDNLTDKNVDEKYIEMRLQPATAGQKPMIRFSFTSSPSAKYGGKAAWFEKGKSQYYKSIDDLSGHKYNSLLLYSDDFNLAVSILQPEEENRWAYICLLYRNTGKGIWFYMMPDDVKEVMDMVSREVKKLGFPKSNHSSLDI